MNNIKIKPATSHRFRILYKFDDSELATLAKLKVSDINECYTRFTEKCDIDEYQNTFLVVFRIPEHCINEFIECVKCIKHFNLIYYNEDDIELDKRYFEIKEFDSIKYSLDYTHTSPIQLVVSGKYIPKI